MMDPRTLLRRLTPAAVLLAAFAATDLVAQSAAPSLDASAVGPERPAVPATAEDEGADARPAGIAAALQPDPARLVLLPTGGELAASALPDGAHSRIGEPPALRQPRARGSVPLMAAGGTLLVAGAVIGGDAGTLVMLTGAGLLAWGVYLHF